MHELQTNPSLQFHILQQLWRDVSLGNRGKQRQSDVAEESRVPEVCLLQCLHGNSRLTL